MRRNSSTVLTVFHCQENDCCFRPEICFDMWTETFMQTTANARIHAGISKKIASDKI